MRRRKICLTAMALAALLAFTVGCGSGDTKSMTPGQPGDAQNGESSGGNEAQSAGAHNGEAKSQESEEAEQGTKEQEDKEDLVADDVYMSILEGCTHEFIGGYVIDENFLFWITANYGEDVLYTISEAVESGHQDCELWFQETGSSIHVLWDSYCRDTGFQDYRLERVAWKECAEDDRIVMDFIGDVNFDEDWSTMRYLDQQVDGIFNCLSEPLMEELNRADILVVNNEFTYSTHGTPIEGKDYVFRADPDRVYLFQLMGADLASVANNHAYDYGPEGLVDTLDTLEGAGIPHVGGGRNLEEAMKPFYFIANGRKVAVVAATQIERTLPYTKEATEDSPGVLKTLNPDKFVKVIEEAKTNADYVIVYVHWGTEQNPNFESDQTALADAYIKAGADAIIGAHTHCLQGCEYREGVPIIYSLGNFWFNSVKLDTGVLQLVIQRDGSMDFQFLPCVQSKNRTYLVEDEAEKQRILDYMESISVGVTIDDSGYITPKD